jgi:hypothetical protein
MNESPDPLFRIQWRELIPFAVAVISGAISGSAVSFSSARKSPEVLTAFLVGYAICGAFGAVMALAGAWVFIPALIGSVPNLVLFTGIAGLITSLALAGSNLTMRFILKKLGVEVVIDLRRTSPEVKVDE